MNGQNDELGSKILAFFEAAAHDPSIVEEYRAGGPAYLQEQWGFTEDDVQRLFPEESLTWAMTVLPQPPIVFPPTPPTVL